MQPELGVRDSEIAPTNVAIRRSLLPIIRNPLLTTEKAEQKPN